MDKEARLQAEEQIMDAVCALCRWPYVYDDEELMYTARCDQCPAAIAVSAVLDKIKTEE
jgi:hypothetical protein